MQLPALRQELALHPGPRAADGTPTWTLHDPSDNRFFQIGWAAFEMLSRWSLGTGERLLAAIARETTLSVDQAALEDLLRFLLHHHLVAAHFAPDTARLEKAAQATRLSKAMWLLKHYLFIRVPLVRPMPFLRAVSPYIQWIYTPLFWWAVVLCAAGGLLLAAQQWDQFVHTFAAYADWRGLVGIGVALSAAKLLHELGHAFTAYRHGCRVAHMGVAFLVMWPVLYTDTNEAWKLASRRQRLQIGIAGMAAEIALAAAATLLWSFLPDGPVRGGVFLLATSTWLLTLAINLSPFMRFDGYFLLSDWLDMPNLHSRAFALGRWRMREWLFGLGDPPPEGFAPRRARFLITFAYGTWLYRLTLFLSIAFLVYHVFFKTLGIFLLAIELGWFIALPVWRELTTWWQLRDRMQWHGRTLRAAALFGAVLLVLVVPWRGSVRAPAIVEASHAQKLYAPVPAQVAEVAVREGERVHAGQILARLTSPELDYELSGAAAREKQLRWQVEQQAFDSRLLEAGEALRTRWQAAQEEVAGLKEVARQLELRAPFDGVVAARSDALLRGQWLARGEAVLQVVSEQGSRVQAYVAEEDLPRIDDHARARFVADAPGTPAIDCRVMEVDRVNLAQIDAPQLASVFGGPIPSVRQGQIIAPLRAVFRVRMDDCVGASRVHQERAGAVSIDAAARSFAASWLRQLGAILRREGSL
ncbi:HlyD family efflux transporter periplasmic adaptor subunit [Uliginosibacterium sp. sgz301328]|uniref:HlyD family efflux transporter periplasmic adaptor subunit n=1 Tax=Uliginosibacterium sp. sgz301328 TaxID=3243764 RepID=UPI00359CC58A